MNIIWKIGVAIALLVTLVSCQNNSLINNSTRTSESSTPPIDQASALKSLEPVFNDAEGGLLSVHIEKLEKDLERLERLLIFKQRKLAQSEAQSEAHSGGFGSLLGNVASLLIDRPAAIDEKKEIEDLKRLLALKQEQLAVLQATQAEAPIKAELAVAGEEAAVTETVSAIDDFGDAETAVDEDLESVVGEKAMTDAESAQEVIETAGLSASFEGAEGRAPAVGEENAFEPPPTIPADVDSLLNRMGIGAIAFNAPDKMNIAEAAQIHLILSQTETVEKLKLKIVEEGELLGANIEVGDRMKAHLTGRMFQIDTITNEIQAVSKSRSTEWKWDIYPKEEGKHNLHLSLIVLIDVDGINTPRDIKTFDKIIEVDVTGQQKFILFIQNNWKWLWTTIFVPIGVFFWKRKRK